MEMCTTREDLLKRKENLEFLLSWGNAENISDLPADKQIGFQKNLDFLSKELDQVNKLLED